MIARFTEDQAEDLAAQDAALDVPCPWCHADRDAYCTSPVTGQHLAGRVSHWQRIPTRTETT